MSLITRPEYDPKITRWWWRPLRTWVYDLVNPLWQVFRGENSDDIALENVTAINGVTPSELAILDGLTATTAELNLLSGLTAGSAELNKADRTEADGRAEVSRNVVLDSAKSLFGKGFDINRSLIEAIAGGPYFWFGGDDHVAVSFTSGGPLGFWSLMCLIGATAGARAHSLTDGRDMGRLWVVWCGVACFVGTIGWLLASLYFLSWIDWWPIAVGVFASILLFPIVLR